MSRESIKLAATAVSLLAALSCSPYPVYNASGTASREARVEAEEDDSNPADHEPATGDSERRPGIESRRVQSERAERGVIAAGTTIDPRLFKRIVETYIGTPYKRGGDNLRGIDCSNLVASIYRDYDGTKLPESTRGLYRLPDVIEDDDLQIGDLLFFKFAETRSPSHVGIYLGNKNFVHSSETNGVVISSFDDNVYRSAYRGARRVAPQLHSGE